MKTLANPKQNESFLYCASSVVVKHSLEEEKRITPHNSIPLCVRNTNSTHHRKTTVFEARVIEYLNLQYRYRGVRRNKVVKRV